jgi:hypothetical protein
MRNGLRNRKGKSNGKKPVRIEQGSGNVFADLGFSNPDLALAKAELVQRIRELIENRKLTQEKAAKLLGLDQPRCPPWCAAAWKATASTASFGF